MGSKMNLVTGFLVLLPAITISENTALDISLDKLESLTKQIQSQGFFSRRNHTQRQLYHTMNSQQVSTQVKLLLLVLVSLLHPRAGSRSGAGGQGGGGADGNVGEDGGMEEGGAGGGGGATQVEVEIYYLLMMSLLFDVNCSFTGGNPA